MTNSKDLIAAALDDALLSLDDLCRIGRVSPQWVIERVESGLLVELGGAPETWRFDAVVLRRVRRMASLERDFEAAPELAALVADLQDEIERLRSQLQRAGYGTR